MTSSQLIICIRMACQSFVWGHTWCSGNSCTISFQPLYASALSGVYLRIAATCHALLEMSVFSQLLFLCSFVCECMTLNPPSRELRCCFFFLTIHRTDLFHPHSVPPLSVSASVSTPSVSSSTHFSIFSKPLLLSLWHHFICISPTSFVPPCFPVLVLRPLSTSESDSLLIFQYSVSPMCLNWI